MRLPNGCSKQMSVDYGKNRRRKRSTRYVKFCSIAKPCWNYAVRRGGARYDPTGLSLYRDRRPRADENSATARCCGLATRGVIAWRQGGGKDDVCASARRVASEARPLR